MKQTKRIRIAAALLGGFIFTGLATSPNAQAETFNLSIVDGDGNPYNGFRYIVQEDCMFPVDPQAVDPTPEGEQAFNFHRSHCHVIRQGRVNGGSASVIDVGDLTGTTINDCFVSVIPNNPNPGVQTGAAKVPGCNTNTTVVVPNGAPFQTSQISVKVFYDGFGGPLNNSPDVGEPGLAGFSVLVEDAGGQVQQDAFGNPLGTTYQQNPDGTYVLDVEGMPTVDVLGTGEIVTSCSVPDCSAPGDGELVIKFLAPGKYGIITVPPTANLNDPACDPNTQTIDEIASNPQCAPGWYQNTTIEGTKVVDAWVAPGNGERLVEFGPSFPHIFHGWTPADHDQRTALGVDGAFSISGQVNKSHLAPPPGREAFDGPPFLVGQNGVCLVAVNTIGGVSVEGAGVAECDADGNFSIGGFAPGLYQLVVWDKFLHIIIGFQTVEILADGSCPQGTAPGCDLGQVQGKMWFNELVQNVYFDSNENGVWDAGELPLLEQATLVRFRDGTEYQAFPTDGAGSAPYESIFPWFHWLVTEVDFGRFKATGATTVNDLGGPVTFDEFGEGVRNPDVTTILSYDDPLNPSVGGPVLTQAMQGFAGQSLRIDWGKALWRGEDPNTPEAEAENGGVSGIVHYATTRAEDNPEQYAPEPWEPGIPDVQVALFAARIINAGTIYENENIVNVNGIAGAQQPDEDNWPLGNFPGPEDINRCDAAGPLCNRVQPGLGYTDGFDYGDAIDITWTDSWDANKPTGCPHSLDVDGDGNPDDLPGGEGPGIKCFDGLANWNQIRDGLFDGGYAFGAGGYEDPTGNFPSDLVGASSFVQTNFTPAAPGHLPGGSQGYIVQVYPPRSRFQNAQGIPQTVYKISRSQDKNVDFGPNFTPSTAALPEGVGRCTGGIYTVPAELALFPGVDAPLAGQTLFHCNQRFQFLADSGEAGLANNSAVNFYLHTEVPVAAKAIGRITDDLANETAAGKPNSTEKFSVPFLPIAFFDYAGNEFNRIYSSEFASYNTLLPATVSQNLPIPSGISPMMVRFCNNHPGPLADGTFPDPNYDARYSTTCYTFNFEPGKATYLDTPVIRLAAFVGPLQAQTDCSAAAAVPVINNVTTSDYAGPVLSGDAAGKTITIVSQGDELVPDPFSGNQTDVISRDHGFGNTQGTVSVVYEGGQYTFPAAQVSWSNGQITATVPATVPAAFQTGQVVVIRGDNGESTTTGVTLHVGVDAGTVSVVTPADPGLPIQDAVDAAADGDLILVTAGTYDENVIVYKEIVVQGAGAPSTRIFASPLSLGPGTPQLPGESDKLVRWKNNLADLVAGGEVGVLPGQLATLPAQDAPGFLVMPSANRFANNPGNARIDGFHIQGSNLGGGIFVNAYADGLFISNNKTIGNLGQYGGGIRIGNPLQANLLARGAGGQQDLDPADLEGSNPDITIAYNEVVQNKGFFNGGGIALYTGADNYEVSNNLVCGNFSRTGGGGISQVGRVGGLGAGVPGDGNAEDGVIRDNRIIFNEVFQGNEVGGGGGGIELAGESPAALGNIPGSGLTEGTGSITIDRNLFHGNLGGAAPGGAISLKGINGEDVTALNDGLTSQGRWHRILVLNNLVQNNVSGQWGAGINLSDAVRVDVIHNTVANNDNASVAQDVRDPGGNTSDPQPAGLVAQVHSTGLAAAMATQTAIGGGNDRVTYAHPAVLKNNIFNGNRSFWLDNSVAETIRPLSQHPAYAGLGNDDWDLGVVGVPGECLRPRYSLLARTGVDTPDNCAYDGTNLNNDIALNAGFVNPLTLDLVASTAADEGGNDTQLLFTPLTLVEVENPVSRYDYHITPFSSAVIVGQDLTGRYGSLGTPLAVDVDAETRPSGNGLQDAGADQVSNGTAPVNNPPVAVNDAGAGVGARTDEGVPTAIMVLLNDSDPDLGDVISVSQITTQPANGTAEIQGDGTILYRPFGGFTGNGVNRDEFFYEIEDSGGLTDTARVLVRVDPTAALPETITVTTAQYKQESGIWQVEGTTDLQVSGGTMEIRLHRNGALIATGVTVDQNNGVWNTGEVAPADPAAVPQAGDHIIIRSVPNNQTADGTVTLN